MHAKLARKSLFPAMHSSIPSGMVLGKLVWFILAYRMLHIFVSPQHFSCFVRPRRQPLRPSRENPSGFDQTLRSFSWRLQHGQNKDLLQQPQVHITSELQISRTRLAEADQWQISRAPPGEGHPPHKPQITIRLYLRSINLWLVS